MKTGKPILSINSISKYSEGKSVDSDCPAIRHRLDAHAPDSPGRMFQRTVYNTFQRT
jgi:hypothetical protein